MSPITPLSITAYSLVSPIGAGAQQNLDALRKSKSGLRQLPFDGLTFDTWLGQVDDVEKTELEQELSRFHCRNNRLAKLALDTDHFRTDVQQAIHKYGHDRIGVFLGTSTSGIAETERAYLERDPQTGALPNNYDFMSTHNIGSVLAYVQLSLGLTGPGQVISTACSSSAKVFAAAQRYINAGFCDAAIVGGIDSLCLTTLYGFHSLQLVSPDPCAPWDVNRSGINIGEAAGFVLLEMMSEGHGNVKFKGYGESSDAYHMSAPQPDGEGARQAMLLALKRAGLATSDIGYINLHGTGTPSNDRAEAQGLYRVFGENITCSSTKGFTGHTLGAAGITEAIFSIMTLEHGFVPANVGIHTPDPDLPVNVVTEIQQMSIENVMHNSFGFGGSNCSLVFGW